MTQRTVIAGAGQAGFQVAQALRAGGFNGEISLLGREPHAPYQRPPLSKQLLKREWAAEKCRLRQEDFYLQHEIELRTGVSATALDADARTVSLDTGESLPYDHLAICTGSRLNRLHFSGSGLAGVHYLRTLDQSEALADALAGGCRVAIAGGGYIGLEVAASARSLGCEVTVIEAQDHIMQRSALGPIADFLLARHRAEGVDIRPGRMLTEILGRGKVHSVVLDDGAIVDADVLLKGIGVRPDLRWLEGSGLETGRGVVVDSRCRTNLPNVYAAGDVCESRHALFAGTLVLESVQNAIGQGKLVAAGILGREEHYTEVPWFWSDQFDCRVQMAGVPQAGDELVIRDSGPNSVSVLSLGSDRLNAIQCVNAARDFIAGRKLIARAELAPVNELRNPRQELKDLL